MEEKEMTFWAHLEDLRWTLVRVVAVLFVFVVVCFCLMPYLFDNFSTGSHHVRFPALQMAVETGRRQSAAPRFQQRPLLGRTHQHQRCLAVPDAHQHLVLVCTGADIPLPDVRNMAVVQPALFDNEKKSVGMAFAFGTFMFFLGCAVGYFLVFPFTFRFLTEYQLSPLITNQISLTSYMGNFLMLIFVMGIVFELPLLAWLLSKLGLVTKTFFRQYRKHARSRPAGALLRSSPRPGRPVHANDRLPAALPAL